MNLTFNAASLLRAKSRLTEVIRTAFIPNLPRIGPWILFLITLAVLIT
ncbi:MAG: hypothetical protein HY460_00750, partial [Parcubacteria group bacterium]|nr:hypothetical protein [Parcubacteria group bacterium]